MFLMSRWKKEQRAFIAEIKALNKEIDKLQDKDNITKEEKEWLEEAIHERNMILEEGLTTEEGAKKIY